MLIEPRPGAMLRLTADAMEAATGDARQQRAATWLLRDLARTLDARNAAIAADIADMRALVPEAPAGASAGTDAHVQLQAHVEALARDRAMHGRLRALHLRMLERERALLGPPGGNPSLREKT